MEALTFTAKDIAFIEKTTDKALILLIQDPKVSNLVLFIQKGLKLTLTDEAYTKFEEWIAQGEITETIHLHIYEALIDQGFLSTPDQAEWTQVKENTLLLKTRRATSIENGKN